jgi:hypothetical protein
VRSRRRGARDQGRATGRSAVSRTITLPQTELDPDRRIVAMLGARGTVVALEGGGEKEAVRC